MVPRRAASPDTMQAMSAEGEGTRPAQEAIIGKAQIAVGIQFGIRQEFARGRKNLGQRPAVRQADPNAGDIPFLGFFKFFRHYAGQKFKNIKDE